MRRDDPGREAGRTGGTRLAEASEEMERRFAGWQQPAGLRPGVLEDGFLHDLPHSTPEGGAADQLAALVARAAHAPAGTIHLMRDGQPQVYGTWGPDLKWDQPGFGGASLSHPVHDRAGEVIGICAALDPQPREWSAEETAAQVSTKQPDRPSRSATSPSRMRPTVEIRPISASSGAASRSGTPRSIAKGMRCAKGSAMGTDTSRMPP